MNDSVNSYPIPLTANATFLIILFAIACLISHLILVVHYPLRKIGWKRVDYIWLPLTLLGVASAAGSNRQTIARSWLNLADSRFAYAEKDLARTVREDMPAASCRTFVRTQYSPPADELEHLQKQYDSACAWAGKAPQHLPKGVIAERSALTPRDFGAPNDLPSEVVTPLGFSILNYNETLADKQRLEREASVRSEIEWTLIELGPALIALALALRITKVTGEIRLERRGLEKARALESARVPEPVVALASAEKLAKRD